MDSRRMTADRCMAGIISLRGRMVDMKIGVLGSGIVGRTLGAGFVKHGHQVKLGTRDPLDKDVAALVPPHPGATAGTFADAAGYGEVLLLGVKGQIVDKVIELAKAENFTGKTVIDANNPIADAPDRKSTRLN